MILHVTDFHKSERWFQWLISVSYRYSLICLTGDIMDLNPQVPHAGQLETILPLLRCIRAPLALVSGNHDSVAFAGPRFEHARWLGEIRRENVWVDGDSFEFSKHLFRCIPWNGTLPVAGPNEVWLHHAPPGQAKTAISRGGCDFGSFDLGEHLKEGLGPRLILSGHVHDPVSNSARMDRCWSLNPALAANSPTPNYFEINLEEGIAVRRGATGVKSVVNLWQPLKPVENGCQ